MAIAPLTPLPSPPLSTDTEAVFNSKADATLLAEKAFVEQMNSSTIPGINQAVADSQAARAAAAGSATAAAGSATSAASQVGLAAAEVTKAAAQVTLAADEREGAEAARDAAEVFAQAAGAAVGPAPQPSKFLGSNAYGVIGWYDAGDKVGDYLVSLVSPDNEYVEAGRISYLQSAYPALYQIVGLVPDADRSIITNVTFRPSGEVGTNLAYADNGALIVSVNTAGSYLYTSSDRGETWTKRAFPVTTSVYSVVWNPGAGLFLASTNTSPFYTSPDGINWTARSFPAGQNTWVANYINGLFVVMPAFGATSNSAFTSPDGITWTSRTTNLGSIDTVVRLNGQLVAYSGGAANINYTSDGLVWNAVALTAVSAMAFSKGLYFATRISVKDTIRVASSLAGPWTTLSIANIGGTVNWYNSMSCYSGSKGVIAFFTDGGFAVVSNDGGLTWVQRPVPAGVNSNNGCMSIDNGKKFFIFSGQLLHYLPIYSYDSTTAFITPPVAAQVPPAKTYIKAKIS